MRRQFLLAHDPLRGWHVDLPTYVMIAGTVRPAPHALLHANGVNHNANVAAVLALNPTVDCEIPDNYYGDDAGDLNLTNLRRIYKGHPRYDRPDYAPPKPDLPIPQKPLEL